MSGGPVLNQLTIYLLLTNLFFSTRPNIIMCGVLSVASLGQLSGGVEGSGPELAVREGAPRCHE